MNRKLQHRRLYVRNLSDDTTSADLDCFFAQYGVVTGVLLRRDRVTGALWGHAYVEMETAVDTKIAIKGANGQILNNRQIGVTRAGHT
jgi:RNA recognition motif-containing protein